MDLREAAELVRQCVLNTTTGREVYPGQRCVQPGVVALSVARKLHEALRVIDLALATECAAREAAERERDEATRTRDAACMQELRTRKAMQRLADQEGQRYGDPLRALVPPSHEKMLRCVWGDVHGPHECIVGGMVAAQSLWRCVIGGRPNATFAVTDLNGCVLWNEQDAEDGAGDAL